MQVGASWRSAQEACDSGIRGTHTVYDLITDIVSSSDNEVTFEGYSTHFGTAEAARWFHKHEMQTIKKCLEENEDDGGLENFNHNDVKTESEESDAIQGNDEKKQGKYFYYDTPYYEDTGPWIPVSVPPRLEGRADFIIVLRSSEAVKTFCGNAHLSFGTGVSVAAGAFGRTELFIRVDEEAKWGNVELGLSVDEQTHELLINARDNISF
ncbi:hypothetical protein LINGRAHAP2_LOCUS15510 [Linum grandiflorum]